VDFDVGADVALHAAQDAGDEHRLDHEHQRGDDVELDVGDLHRHQKDRQDE